VLSSVVDSDPQIIYKPQGEGLKTTPEAKKSKKNKIK
jgi:hypothetical protein